MHKQKNYINTKKQVIKNKGGKSNEIKEKN